MAKIRIYALGKELGVGNPEIIDYLGKQGIEVKSASSSVEEDVADRVRKAFGKTSSAATEPERSSEPEKPAKPEQPEKPAKQESPAEPERPAKQKEPEKPVKQEEPAKAEKPVKQDEPAKPETQEKLSENSAQAAPAKPAAARPQEQKKVQVKPRTGQQGAGGAGQQGTKGAGNQPRKTKIIMVSNPGNSQTGRGPATAYVSGRRSGSYGSDYGNSTGQRQFIRPRVKPTRVSGDADLEERIRQQRERKEAERARIREEERKREEAAAAEKAAKEQAVEARNDEAASAPAKDAVSPKQGAKPSGGLINNLKKKNSEPSVESFVNVTRKSGVTPAAPGAKPAASASGGHYTKNLQSGGGRVQAGTGGFSGSNSGRRPGKRPGKPGSAGAFGNGPERSSRKSMQDGGKRLKKPDQMMGDDDGRVKPRKAGSFIKPEKAPEPEEEKIKVITLPERLTIKELSDKMKLQPSVIIKKLFMNGQLVTVNSELPYEEAENIAADFDILCEKEEKVDVIEELLREDEEDPSKLKKRPPVVVVMGHVDHGKTSLLDAIRNTRVTTGEAGGITQAIGAYTVESNGQPITFLDTPGHEAFTAMRMRGANSTDIAVLVVAADDGVMPQTVEAINHAKAAGIEIIVAINKIDKPNANPEKVKQELTEYDLVPTGWGGTTEFVNVSAKSGEGIDTLLETILLTADILELKANPNRNARGVVIEARLDKGRGPVATVLVQKGTLRVGNFISAGACHGRIRAMISDSHENVQEAGPSVPVAVLGLNDVPEAGETFVVHENEKTARSFAQTYMDQHKEELVADTKQRMSLDELSRMIKEGDAKELDIIIKADVQGSVEALRDSLLKLSNEEVIVKVIHGGVGTINESDVILASASNAVIIGFNVRTDATAKSTAEREKVDIRLYKVIYQAIEDVEAAMKGMLEPVYEERVTGHAEVRQIFKASAVGNIAGSFVTDGVVKKDSFARIFRDEEQVFQGKLASLKRFKDDVKEVKEGYECGLVFEDFDSFNEGDRIEFYEMVEVSRA